MALGDILRQEGDQQIPGETGIDVGDEAHIKMQGSAVQHTLSFPSRLTLGAFTWHIPVGHPAKSFPPRRSAGWLPVHRPRTTFHQHQRVANGVNGRNLRKREGREGK